MCLLLLQYCWAAILKSASSSASDYCWTCDWLASSASWILTVGLMQPDCSQEITQFPAVSMTVSLSLWLACLFEGSWKPQKHNNWPHGCASWLVSGACGPLLGEAWNYGSWKSSRLNLRHLYCMAYTRDPVQCSDTWIQTSVLHCKLLVSVPNYYFKTQIYGGMLPCLEWCEHHLLYPSGTWHQWMLLSVTTLCVKIKMAVPHVAHSSCCHGHQLHLQCDWKGTLCYSSTIAHNTFLKYHERASTDLGVNMHSHNAPDPTVNFLL